MRPLNCSGRSSWPTTKTSPPGSAVPLFERAGYAEKKMFGGLCFLLHGNMACGILRDLLIVRVGPEHYAEALGHPGCSVFDFTGRAMTGWVQISPAVLAKGSDLEGWLQKGIDYALSLPPK